MAVDELRAVSHAVHSLRRQLYDLQVGTARPKGVVDNHASDTPGLSAISRDSACRVASFRCLTRESTILWPLQDAERILTAEAEHTDADHYEVRVGLSWPSGEILWLSRGLWRADKCRLARR